MNNPIIICHETAKFQGTYIVRYQEKYIKVGSDFDKALDVLFMFYDYFNVKRCMYKEILFQFFKAMLKLPHNSLVYANIMVKLMNQPQDNGTVEQPISPN